MIKITWILICFSLIYSAQQKKRPKTVTPVRYYITEGIILRDLFSYSRRSIADSEA